MASIDGTGLRISLGNSLERAKDRGVITPSVRARSEDASADAASKRVSGTLAGLIDGKLRRLEEALARFDWSDESTPWRTARLATKGPELEDKASVELHYGDDVEAFIKRFSKGFYEQGAHTLEDKTYALRFSLDGESTSVEFTVDAADKTWGDVLQKIADGINTSSLPVQAEIIYQHRAEQRIEGLLRTGSMLALSVERGYAAQDLSIDTRYEIARLLDFESATAPTNLYPTARGHSLRGIARNVPSSGASPVYDPNEASMLAAGTYYFTYATGGAAQTLSVVAQNGDTMEDLLQSVARAINTSQAYFSARVDSVPRTAYVGDERITTGGIQLTISLENPKLDERLALAGRAGDTAAALHDPTAGLPTNPAVGDSYIATANNTALGWDKDSVYTFNGTSWIETAPTEGMAFYVTAEDANYSYDGAAWQSSGDLVATLGLDALVHPGQDAVMVIDGRTEEAATGVFSLDQGRVSVAIDQTFGESLPLVVSQAVEVVEKRFSEVVGTYNDLRTVLVRNQAFLDSSLLETLQNPLDALSGELARLGVAQTGTDGLVWVNGEQFWDALLRDAARAEDALWTANAHHKGLIPALQDAAASIRAAGIDSFITQRATTPAFPWRQDADNEQEQKLLDLFG